MKKIKVIIADDNRIINDIISTQLEKYEEIEVLGKCYSVQDEIFMIESLKPDLVITDLYRNGELSGLEVIKKYKEIGNLPKFLVITAGGDELVDTKIMDGFISKPFHNYDDIGEQVKRIKEQIYAERLPIKSDIGKVCTKKSIFSRIFEIIKEISIVGR